MRTRTAVVGAAALLVALGVAVAGCGQTPRTVALEAGAPAASIPPVCLATGLTLALGYGAYAVPVAGVPADVSSQPSWQNAALQLAPVTSVAAGDGPFTLCTYVSDHPSPFTTRGGDDTVVCVLVSPTGTASVVGTRTVAPGSRADCSAT